MNNSADTMKVNDDHSPLGEAARRKRQQILCKVTAPGSSAFLKNQYFKNVEVGLDLFCNEGAMTFQLAQILSPDANLKGVDYDSTNIKIAKENNNQFNKKVNFLLLENDNWVESNLYDFIYCRIFLNKTYSPFDLLEKMHFSLKPDGFVLIEYFEESKVQCFPQSYAFDRSIQLHTALNEIKNTAIFSVDLLREYLQKANFNNLQFQRIAPAFLPEDCKRIASLSLEHNGTQIIEQKLTNQYELQALLFELQTFEKQKNTMISLPGIYQAIGYKQQLGR